MRRFQVSLRFLLIATFVSAIIIAVWCSRPSPEIYLRVESGGIVYVDNRQVPLSTLSFALGSQRKRREWWQLDSKLLLRADSGVKTSTVQTIIVDAQAAGIELFELEVN